VRVPGRLGGLLEECTTLVQVALDTPDPLEAVRIGVRALAGPGVILEAGTPLVKSYGARAAGLLRAVGSPAVVADMKTFDTGALEARIAWEGGADATTVLALAPDETVRGAVEEAEKRGMAVIADLIGHRDPVGAAGRLAGLGVHIVLLHVGVDTQRMLGVTAEDLLGLIPRVAEAFGGPVAVAGGIRPESAGDYARAGASIVVIGSGITRAPDPRRAVVEALRGVRPTCT